MTTIGDAMVRVRQKQAIMLEILQDRLDLFKIYGTGDGNDIRDLAFYESQINEHLAHPHEHTRAHFVRLAAYAIAAIEAIERADDDHSR